MNACITTAYGNLSDGVKGTTGEKLYVSSSIRDKNHQQELYVGFPHAEIIYNNRLTLEEYINSSEMGVCYAAKGYLITRQRPVDGKVYVPTGCESYVVSPDNKGCYIITGKEVPREY